MWPSSIYEGHNRIVYLYLRTKLTNRLDDITEVNEYIETTLLQSTFSLQNNHEIVSFKADILHSNIPFIFQVCNNILTYPKLYNFVISIPVSGLTTKHNSTARLRFQSRGEKNIVMYAVIISASILCIVCILLGISPASDCCLPTFRNPLSVPSSRAGCRV